ncbi:MAG: hypothetical protein IKL10_04605 [Clostridia bacterium]|nr:hypothetical protein [Clostridia bacterium]
MKKELLKSMKTAALFIAFGLFISFIVFFLLFGKGLQILMPFMLFFMFFFLFFVLEKLPFISKKPLLKLIIAVIFIIGIIIII